ncbi:hypothetical protein NW758_014013 [Fusarium oxysporum]|nr:hypothetical protein NW758_014013 [Fusarium oxysporum]
MFMLLDKHSRTIFITVTVTFLVASLFALGRVVSRFGIARRHGWDDYVFIVAWILAFGLSFTVAFGNSTDFRDGNTTQLRTQYATMVMFIPSLATAKISILLLYIDIARQSQKFLRVGSYVTLVVVLLGGVILTFLTAFRCRPVEAAYNLAALDIWLIAWPINIATELAILVLPIPALSTLPLKPWRKSMVILSFILGVTFVGVIDVARIYNLQLAVINSEHATALRPFNIGMALLWSAIEVNTAIIGAAIPTLPPMIKRLIPSKALGLLSHESTRILMQHLPSQAGSQHSPSANGLEYHSNRNGSLATVPALPEQDMVYFSFINLEQPKCIVEMRGSECVKYCAVINLLLFLNGFIYSMLFSINATIPVVKTRTQAVGMSSACYVGAGILSPTTGYPIMRCVGLKATIATSLAISCVGTLIFWPCGAVKSYPGFIVGNILVGASLGIMEIIATLQWAYLIIALFTVLLGLLYWYVPLPHVMGPDLRTRSGILTVDLSKKHFNVLPVVVVSVGIAALSGFCAAGALASLRTSIGSVLSIVSNRTNTVLWLSIPNFQTSLTAVYAVGQFLFAFLSIFIPPYVILLSACGAGIALAAVTSVGAFPSAAIAQQVTLAMSIFLGGIPNLVVAIALRGLGWWTALVCSLLIGSCSLGAGIWPWAMMVVSSSKSVQYAYYVIIALFAVCSVLPLYLILFHSSRGR